MSTPDDNSEALKAAAEARKAWQERQLDEAITEMSRYECLSATELAALRVWLPQQRGWRLAREALVFCGWREPLRGLIVTYSMNLKKTSREALNP